MPRIMGPIISPISSIIWPIATRGLLAASGCCAASGVATPIASSSRASCMVPVLRVQVMTITPLYHMDHVTCPSVRGHVESEAEDAARYRQGDRVRQPCDATRLGGFSLEAAFGPLLPLVLWVHRPLGLRAAGRRRAS